MQTMAHVAFGVYAFIILAGAILAVASASLVRALVGLITTLLGVAGMYLLLASPFLAFMQLLIYVGAVSVMIFFAVMLTHAQTGGDESAPAPVRKFLLAAAGAAVPALVLGGLLYHRGVSGAAKPAVVGVEKLGTGLLGAYVLPFELISVILMVAMCAAVLLVWEKRGKRK